MAGALDEIFEAATAPSSEHARRRRNPLVLGDS